ncbi:pilus assembly protein PilM [Rubripirellula obstinata]|nr:pilus assembly protein PilM [Rubripirellula obstinata]
MSTKDMAAVGVVCAACDQPNSAEAKFCRGCGHTLYEPCEKCVQPVLLGQKFCGGCGADLDQIVAKKQKQYDEDLASAVAAAKEFEFETSLGLLQRVAEIQDFRFRASAEAAQKAVSRVVELQEKTTSATTAKVAQALAHHQAGELSDVVRLLKDVPSKLLDEETRKIYVQSAGVIEQLKSLEQEFSAASRDKNWVLAGELVHQLQEALPEDRMYQKASTKIAAKLYAKAEALFAAQKYDAAGTRLASIPQRSMTPESEKLIESIEAIQWLKSTIESEPFATPTLGRLAVRLSKLVPDAPDAPGLVKEIAKTLKESRRHPRNHLPPWRGSNSAWTGGDLQFFTRPTKIEFDEGNELLRTKLGRFSVAIGLAIQGLGKARITDEYSMQKKKRNLFGRNQDQPCWGIDVGSHSVKAARLEMIGDTLVLADLFYQELDTGNINVGGAQNSYDQLQPAMDEFKKAHDLESCLVWANLPGSEVTTRFVRLPPVDDKKASELIDQEIRDRIPVPMDELVISRSIAAYDKEDSHGRPLVFSAARKIAVEKRLELFEQTGIKLDGMQADPNAIVNLVAWEFADQLSPATLEDVPANDSEAVKSKAASTPKKKLWGKKQVKAAARFDDKTPAIAWVDAGAASTTLLYVSDETHWFWTVETGGDNLTSALARTSKKTHVEAESLKVQPERLERSANDFSSIELKMDEMQSRFQKIAEDALKQNDRFDVLETYVSGGAALTMGWMRRWAGKMIVR